jgi:phosphate transport system ATP-binding protein
MRATNTVETAPVSIVREQTAGVAEQRFAATPKMSIRQLDFFYGAFQALKRVSFDIADREVTAFIGPTGCGKSTL